MSADAFRNLAIAQEYLEDYSAAFHHYILAFSRNPVLMDADIMAIRLFEYVYYTFHIVSVSYLLILLMADE